MKLPVVSADNIAVVASATCSSNAIREACRASINRALADYSASQQQTSPEQQTAAGQ